MTSDYDMCCRKFPTSARPEKKAIAVLGDTKWPEHASVEVDKVAEKC